ncbi:MAG: NAD-dependent epimerase/dehydratase family protein [Lautropia sp.]|nr:NAD-dependent epimerase/dehydratase family protein [Lautropia sp.]
MNDSIRDAQTTAASDTPQIPQEIALTGASGFVGRHLITCLLQAGFRVRAITRNPAGLPLQPGLQAIAHPGFGTAADWRSALGGVTAVIHCAGIAHVPLGAGRTSLQQLRQVNVAGVRELARAAAACDVQQIMFLSSIKAAGEYSLPGQPLRETDQPRPEDCYGYAKLAAEHHLARLARQHSNLKITTLRPPLIYGRGVKANFAALVKLAQSGLPLPLGAIDNQRSFLYVGNLADAVLTVLNEPERAGGLFHLSDGPGVSTPELIRAIAEAAGKPARLLSIPTGLLGTTASLAGKQGVWQRLAGSLAVDNQAFCQRFGWQPPYTLQEGLADMLAG